MTSQGPINARADTRPVRCLRAQISMSLGLKVLPLVGAGSLLLAPLHNPQLSWREIDATTAEVSAESQAGPARVRLIFKDSEITSIEADDRPRMVGRCIVPTRWRGRCCDYPR